MARTMVAPLVAHRQQEFYGLFMWVTGQRAITGIDIQRSILLYMKAFEIKEDQYDVLKDNYHRMKRDLVTVGIEVEKCQECPEKEPA